MLSGGARKAFLQFDARAENRPQTGSAKPFGAVQAPLRHCLGARLCQPSTRKQAAMPFGYVIANVHTTRPEQMAEYRRWSTQAVAAHGGEFIVRGGQQQVLEGAAHERTVIIRFPSYEAARAFYDSAKYHQARQAREDAGVFNMIWGFRPRPRHR